MRALENFMAKELVRVGRLSLVKGEVEHAHHIKDTLRVLDARECFIHGLTPERALTEPFYIINSRTYTIMLDDEPIAMCGTTPIDESSGRVWLLGTESVNKNYIPFLKGCKKVIHKLQSSYESIENYVPVDHSDTIMWLQWCGFSFDPTLYEISGHTMMRFVRCVETDNVVYLDSERPVMH